MNRMNAVWMSTKKPQPQQEQQEQQEQQDRMIWGTLPMMNPNANYQNSASFVKKLTLAAFSTILYQRRILSDQCFEDTRSFGAQLMLLKEKSGVPLANFVTSSMMAVFDAFTRKYLHEVVFSVYEDARRPGSRIESYSFQFQYRGNSAYITMQGQDNTSNSSNTNNNVPLQLHEAACNMIRSAFESTRWEAPLPLQYELEFRLYYNESAPEDYCPANFKDQPYNDDALLESLGQLASVRTRSHRLAMKKYPPTTAAAAPTTAAAASSASMIGSQSQPLSEANTIDEIPQSQVEPMTGRHDGHDHDREPARRPLRCPCAAYVLGDDVITSHCLKCVYCGLLQHAACYDWHEDHNVPRHCCVECALEDPNRVCTDPILVQLDTRRTRAMCVLRRSLDWCTHADSVTARLFSTSFKLAEGDLKKLISKIEYYGILQPLISTAGDIMDVERPVNNAAAIVALKNRLSRMQTSSQDSSSELDIREHRRRQNPTEEVESKYAHQNETLGQKTTNIEESAVGEDAMLQEKTSPLLVPQRRPETMTTRPVKPKKEWAMKLASAFQSIGEEGGVQDMDIEELPLSGSHNPVQKQQLAVATKKRKPATPRAKGKVNEDPSYNPHGGSAKRNRN